MSWSTGLCVNWGDVGPMTLRSAALLVVLTVPFGTTQRKVPDVCHGRGRSRIRGADRPEDIGIVLLPLVRERPRTRRRHGEACGLPHVDRLVQRVRGDDRSGRTRHTEHRRVAGYRGHRVRDLAAESAPLSALTVAGVV